MYNENKSGLADNAVEVVLKNRYRKYPDRKAPRYFKEIVWPGNMPKFKFSKNRKYKVFTIGSCFARNFEEALSNIPNIVIPTLSFNVPKAEWPHRPIKSTFTPYDCIVTNSYSKSVLRVVATHLSETFNNVDYLPPYEIVTSIGFSAYVDDLVHVKNEIVNKVTKYFFINNNLCSGGITYAWKNTYTTPWSTKNWYNKFAKVFMLQ
jgi:hypothetical protein